jgi:hypothetical protein
MIMGCVSPLSSQVFGASTALRESLEQVDKEIEQTLTALEQPAFLLASNHARIVSGWDDVAATLLRRRQQITGFRETLEQLEDERVCHGAILHALCFVYH